MKNILFTLLTLFMLISCESEEKIKSDIDNLRNERLELRSYNRELKDTSVRISNEIVDLETRLKELNIINSGRTPKYIITFKLKQSHISLDLMKHAKDAMNAIEFTMLVDKEFYNKHDVGDEIVDEFRVGSLIVNNDLGSWNMTIESKIIE